MIDDFIREAQAMQSFMPPTTKEQWQEFLWGAPQEEDERLIENNENN